MTMSVKGRQTVALELDGLEEVVERIERSLNTLLIRSETIAGAVDQLTMQVADLAALTVSSVESLADSIASAITADTQELEQLMSDISAQLDAAFTDLQDRAAAQTTVTQSLTVVMNGVAAEIDDLRAQLVDAGVDPALVARAQAISQTIAGNTDAITAAVITGTDAQDEDVPAGPTPDPGDGGLEPAPVTPDV